MNKVALLFASIISTGTISHVFSMETFKQFEEEKTRAEDNLNPTQEQDLQQEENEPPLNSNPQEIDETKIFNFISSQHPELLNSSNYKKSCENFASLMDEFGNTKENHQKLQKIIQKIIKELADSPLLTLLMPGIAQNLMDILNEIERERKDEKNPHRRGFVYDHRQIIADLCGIVEKQAYALLSVTKKKDSTCIRYSLAALGFTAGTTILVLKAYYNIK